MLSGPSDPSGKKPPPQQEEYLMRGSTGEKVAVGDLTEDEAKDVIRAIIREKRAIEGFVNSMFGGAGIAGLFGEEGLDDVSTTFPAPDKLQ